ncbi:MAG: energy transducer TonB [Porphyromonas sp.]|nr:energy transducer TonB [Porphyromonas sp.]
MKIIRNLTRLLLLLFSITFLTSVKAQKTMLYKGRFGGGEAEYNYYENSDGERIYHGAFTFYSSSIISPFWFHTYEAKGNYSHGLKEGRWIYRHLSGTPDETCNSFVDIADWEDFYVVDYKQGELDGNFIYTSRKDKHHIIRTEKLTMSANRICSVHSIENDPKSFQKKIEIYGQFDSEGFPHGKWVRIEVSDNIYRSEQEYQHGFLMSRVMKNESTGDIIFRNKELDISDVGCLLEIGKSSPKPVIINRTHYGAPKVTFYTEQGNNRIDMFPIEAIPFFLLGTWDGLVPVKSELRRGEKKFPGVPIRTAVVLEENIDPELADQITNTDVREPQFPGGIDAMYKWLSDNVVYPEIAAKNNIQGRVIVSFIVEKDGSISNVKIVRGDPSLDQEAKRVVSSMPRWEPGTVDGLPMRTRASIPVTFRL